VPAPAATAGFPLLPELRSCAYFLGSVKFTARISSVVENFHHHFSKQFYRHFSFGLPLVSPLLLSPPLLQCSLRLIKRL